MTSVQNDVTRKTTFTHCALCEQYCGLAVTTEDGRVTDIQPDKQNPYNWRDFCIKGAMSHLSLNHPDRIRMPMRRVGDHYVEASYQEAIDDISMRLNEIIDAHGPDAVASYAGNPSGFNMGVGMFFTMLLDAIGTRTRSWVGSIDHNPWIVVSERMVGSFNAALQTDIDYSDYMLFIGTNPKISAMNWGGRIPDGWRRALEAQKRGAKIVVVDPRRTETARKADLHIAPLPESDWAFLLGMIKVIFEKQLVNKSRFDKIARLEIIEAIARSADLEDLSARCDVPVQTIVDTAESFAAAKRGFAVSRTGVGQGANGAIGIWLTYVLNAITNRIDAEGGLFYASTCVIDAVKLENTLAPPSPIFRSRVRNTPSIQGYIPLAEIPDEINTPGPGQVRAMIITCGNPVVTGPEGESLDAALQKLDLLVVIDQFQRESHRHAHWLIPGDHFLENEEVNVFLNAFNPVPFVQATRKAVEPPLGKRPEWQFYRDLVLAMDRPLVKGKGKNFNHFVKASRLLARLTGNPAHSFSPDWIIKSIIKLGGRFKWKDIMAAEHGLGDVNVRPRFGDFYAHIPTPDGKLNAAPIEFVCQLEKVMSRPVKTEERSIYPIQIISRRRMQLMNSWMGETSMTKILVPSGDHIEMNAGDCQRLGLAEGQRVKVQSITSSLNAFVKMSTDIRPGVAVMEHGWGSRRFSPREGQSAIYNGGVNRNVLVSNRDIDPLTGVPRANGVAVSVVAI